MHKIVLADQTHVTEYAEQMEILLELLGHPEALVTDESDFGDFLNMDETESIDTLMELNECLGVKVGLKTKLWQAARAMEQAD